MKTCNKDGCDNNQFGGGYCKYHQYLRESKPKEQRLLSTTIHSPKVKKTKPHRANTGELELFKRIWNTRIHKSELSGVSIPMFDLHCFHHLLTKQAYPEYRLDEDNIVILTRTEHMQIHAYSWDDLIEKDIRWNDIHHRYLNMKYKHAEAKNQ